MLADGKAGMLVRPGEATPMADGIIRLLTDNDLRTNLANGAATQREHYRWEVLARQWSDIYCLTPS
jgi:glycosyltransferase involved in cell wall biosynthesis